ncbi:MAG: hypothetical protein ABJN39_13910 [Sulfitobacter sp.]|uniref:hypothetical protein n=1 Tax=unclassified Sulfitobacter TaxID=196795 RepID=UPI002942471E|nr:hypothetical protein [Sulfitobacter sp. LC.270.F.C4]WOI14524.1 hypothetical protein R1T45_15705 [Sulfitobacter sp. LC.270.F.C4]
MIDIGIAGLFDKIEQTIGRFLTKALLVLIGLAVASGCLGIIGNFIGPLWAWALVYDDPTATDVARAANLLMNIVGLVVLAAIVASFIDHKIYFHRRIFELERVTKEGEEALKTLLGYKDQSEVNAKIRILRNALDTGALEKFLAEYQDVPDGERGKTDISSDAQDLNS